MDKKDLLEQLADQVEEELEEGQAHAKSKSEIYSSLGWGRKECSNEDWSALLVILNERAVLRAIGNKSGTKYYLRSKEDIALLNVVSEIRENGLSWKSLNKFLTLCGCPYIYKSGSYTHPTSNTEVFHVRLSLNRDSASKLFEHTRNERNRNVSGVHRKQYTDDMMEGKWYDNGVTLIVNDELIMSDGHHRLAARALADCDELTFSFTFGIPVNQCFGLDENKPRSLRDHFTLGAYDRKKASEMAAKAKYVQQVAFLHKRNAQYGGKISNSIKALVYDEFKTEFEALEGEFPAIGIAKGNPTYLIRSVSKSFLSAMVYASRTNLKSALKFVQLVLNPEKAGEKSSVTAMREWLLRYIHDDPNAEGGKRARSPASTSTRRQQAFAGFITFRAFLDNEEITIDDLVEELGEVESPKHDYSREDYIFFQNATLPTRRRRRRRAA